MTRADSSRSQLSNNNNNKTKTNASLIANYNLPLI